ncbi:MAG TPA: fumarylacetoacetase [Fimbriimonadales bacterium]|nr:fumarylacetoacetase [Fimbriimonadales bacterium]
MNPTNLPHLRSWVPYGPECDFPIQNLPYGVFSRLGEHARVGVAIGDYVLDLSVLYDEGLLSSRHVPLNVFALPRLNEFMDCGLLAWRETRSRVSEILQEDNPILRDDTMLRLRALLPLHEIRLHVPVSICDYVDFYSCEQHATNVGRMFRPENPLLPNWKYMPIGYNGRVSSIVVSGTSIRRPKGQIKTGDAPPKYTATKKLDFETEVGFFTGKRSELGKPISIEEAEEYIFGLVLVNDWSARDIQQWEYQPLGPFLSKSFATSISPWVVSWEALEPWRVQGPKQEPKPLPYLRSKGKWGLDLQLEIALKTAKAASPKTISKVNFKKMYWNMAQQLAHQASNGTNIQVGDLYASGTVSGDFCDGSSPPPATLGCLLELTWGGKFPIRLETGESRTFLEDGDTVIIRGYCLGDGYRIGFGEVSGTILPAL